MPPTPLKPSLPNGNSSPEFCIAVVLPAADGPIIIYQGRAYNAALPVLPLPIFEFFNEVIAASSCFLNCSISALFSGLKLAICESAELLIDCSILLDFCASFIFLKRKKIKPSNKKKTIITTFITQEAPKCCPTNIIRNRSISPTTSKIILRGLRKLLNDGILFLFFLRNKVTK